MSVFVCVRVRMQFAQQKHKSNMYFFIRLSFLLLKLEMCGKVHATCKCKRKPDGTRRIEDNKTQFRRQNIKQLAKNTETCMAYEQKGVEKEFIYSNKK